MKNFKFIGITMVILILNACASPESKPYHSASYELTGSTGRDTINMIVDGIKQGIWIVKKKLGYKAYKEVYEDTVIYNAKEIIRIDTFYYKDGVEQKKPE